ncbi:HNH endonuclease [Pseudomonas sp. NPDC087814]|uniref:HNH endonuclease n=1 Tax=Pseudomonas sp. NPDC087814 TaxID=3364450 RepID=UPI00380E0726
MERDGNKCLLCKCSAELTRQHVMPYSRGGETSPRNLVTLCETCNQHMGAETNRELYDLADLRHSYAPSLAKVSDWSDRAILRAARFSRNIMHTRCELY